MGSDKSSTIDRQVRHLLLLLNNGELPKSVGVFNLGGLASAITGSDSAGSQKKIRASLVRLGVKIER